MCPENRDKGLDSLCYVCPEDCCPLTLTIFFGMALGILMFMVVVPATVAICTVLLVSSVLHESSHKVQVSPSTQCVMWRKKKRMRDESWVINYNDIIISK